MTTDIIARIRKEYGSFSKSHRKLANAVINNYEKVADMTAARLGRFAGVSESTVVRFAGALGFDGYAHFQRAVCEFVKTQLKPNQRIDATKRRFDKKDIIENVMESDINKIRITMENIDKSAFSNAVQAIINAKTIYVMGARGSEPLAAMLQYNLAMIFDNVKFIKPTSSAEVLEQMYSIGHGDVLIAFSFSRHSLKSINAAKFAIESGAEVISLTDSEAAPIAAHSSLLLVAQADMASFMDSLVAPLSIINSMIIEITNRCEKEIRKRFDRLERVWDEYEVCKKF